MTRPIANPAHVPPRPRRRQRSHALLRYALVTALAVTVVVALPTILAQVRALHAGAPQPGGGVSGEQVALSGLQGGACMAFGPSGASKTVFIDPGHGGLDPGVVGTAGAQQVLEKDVALAVGNLLSAELQADGYRVVMSRTSDSSVSRLATADSVTGAMTASAQHRDLVTRAACADAADASVLISIHFDAYDDPSVGGTETIYDAARQFSAENKRLAQDLQGAMVAELGTDDRGIWPDDQVGTPALTNAGRVYGHLVVLGPAEPGYVDTPSSMPGALVEPLFLTNPAEARLAVSTSGQRRIADSLRSGLEKYVSGS